MRIVPKVPTKPLKTDHVDRVDYLPQCPSVGRVGRAEKHWEVNLPLARLSLRYRSTYTSIACKAHDSVLPWGVFLYFCHDRDGGGGLSQGWAVGTRNTSGQEPVWLACAHKMEDYQPDKMLATLVALDAEKITPSLDASCAQAGEVRAIRCVEKAKKDQALRAKAQYAYGDP